MKHVHCLARLGALLALGCAGAGPPPPPGTTFAPPPASPGPARPELVLLVAVSALSPAAYLGPDPSMPTLAALAQAGVAATAVEPVAPASRAPAHTTLVTGRRPARHGIVADRLLGERGVRRAFYDHASYVRGPTLWSVAAEAERPVASLGWPATVGAAIPLLVPDVPAVRPGASWIAELADKTTPWLLGLAGAEGGAAPAASLPGPARDATLAGVACAVLRAPAPPALLLLHLGQTAAAVARYGPDAAEARAAFARADAELGRLLGCLRDAGRLGGAALAVVGDSGALSVHTALSPNAVLEREGLLSRAGATTLRGWRAIARSNGGSAFVYARSEGDAVRARRALEAVAARTGSFRVVSAQEMLGVGADPEAWFGLEARPGYVLVDAPSAPLEAPSARRGAAGYLPGQPAMRPGFVAWGSGLRPRVRVPWMRQIDVAPTLARLLGVGLDQAEGRPLVGALNLPAGAEAGRASGEEEADSGP